MINYLLEDLECFVVLVDGVVLDVLRLLYNKFCWWMCNNLESKNGCFFSNKFDYNLDYNRVKIVNDIEWYEFG